MFAASLGRNTPIPLNTVTTWLPHHFCNNLAVVMTFKRVIGIWNGYQEVHNQKTISISTFLELWLYVHCPTPSVTCIAASRHSVGVKYLRVDKIWSLLTVSVDIFKTSAVWWSLAQCVFRSEAEICPRLYRHSQSDVEKCKCQARIKKGLSTWKGQFNVFRYNSICLSLNWSLFWWDLFKRSTLWTMSSDFKTDRYPFNWAV